MRLRRALARAWYLIAIAMLCGVAGGYFMFTQAAPKYSSTIQIAVTYSASATSNQFDQQAQGMIAAQRAVLLSQIAATPVVISAAVDKAGFPGVTPAVNAGAAAANQIFGISVVDADPMRAAAIANAYPAVLPAQLQKVIGPVSKHVGLQVFAAAAPGAKVSPSLSRNLGLGLIGGLVLGLVGAVLRETLDTTVRDSDGVTDATGLPLLGSVPRSKPRERLSAYTDPRGIRAEAYRQVRTAITNLDPPARVITVTSATSGEGKTTVAVNVATTLASAGHSVIVVDADLRRSTVAEALEVPATFEGLSELLRGEVSLSDAIVAAPGHLPDALVAGKPPLDPSELLGDARFGALIAELRRQYEYVIIDTPPVIPVTDALVVAPHTDGVILVGRVGYTTPERLQRALDGLHRVRVPILGVIPNFVVGGRDRDYRYGYSYTPASEAGEASDELSVGKAALQRISHRGGSHSR